MNEVIKNMEERRSVRGYKPNGNAVTDHRGSDG